MVNINYMKPFSWYHAALSDIIQSPSTRSFNTHFTDQEWAALRTSTKEPVISFTDKPVHAPYRTKGGATTFYCQKRIDGIKYDVHRLGYIYGQYLESGERGKFDETKWQSLLNPDMEVSHTREGYVGSQRNFNPRHLTMEIGFINKSRCGCLFHYLKSASEITGIDMVQRYVESESVFDPDWISENIDPSLFPAQEPLSYGSTSFTQSHCKHTPACAFWRSSWGPIPSKVGSIDGMNA